MKKRLQGLIQVLGGKNRNGTGRGIDLPILIDTPDALKYMFETVTDYLKTAETEQTNRARIHAERDIALNAIKNQRELMADLIARTFDERGQVLAKQFEALDSALANGNVDLVQASLKGMVDVIQSSPFKTVQEMHTALGSKDFVVRLD